MLELGVGLQHIHELKCQRPQIRLRDAYAICNAINAHIRQENAIESRRMLPGSIEKMKPYAYVTVVWKNATDHVSRLCRVITPTSLKNLWTDNVIILFYILMNEWILDCTYLASTWPYGQWHTWKHFEIAKRWLSNSLLFTIYICWEDDSLKLDVIPSRISQMNMRVARPTQDTCLYFCNHIWMRTTLLLFTTRTPKI